MKFFNRSQFSIVEIIFLVLLFITISGYIFFDFKIPDKDYHLYLESSLNSIYYSEDFRDLILNEDLGVSTLTENWTTFNSTLSKMGNNFDFTIVSDDSKKKILNCDEISGKISDERIISINSSGESFNFRKIILGVCY